MTSSFSLFNLNNLLIYYLNTVRMTKARAQSSGLQGELLFCPLHWFHLMASSMDPTAAEISSPCARTYTHTMQPSTQQRNTGMAPGPPFTLQLQQSGIFYAKPCLFQSQRTFTKKNPPVGCRGSKRNLFKTALFQPRHWKTRARK